MKIEYINDNPLDGIKYDYKAIRREFKKLGTPKTVYNPCHLPLETCSWLVTLSERSRGKTTNLLLMGMCCYKLYGTGICYIRSNEQMIMPKQSRDMFSNIISWGYVEKLTDGKYNTITYKSRRWYYALADADGNIEAQDPNAFCIMLSIDKNEQYKSILDTKNDFIIFDEFIERSYYPQQFIMFCDLLSTILRQRQTGHIFLAANTIDIASPYFSELMISEQVKNMVQGDKEYITTSKGTSIYVEILGKRPPRADKKQKEINKLYYGFENPKLVSITGEATWAMSNYPHTPISFRILDKRHYISYYDKLINLEICESEDRTIFINCHFATKTYDDSIIYSTDFSTDPRHRYRLGSRVVDKFIFDKYDKNLFTFADNTVGSLVEKYIDGCRRKAI